MSGHSKWETIKRKKAVNDAKKGKAFSRLSVQITLAARQGGVDPDMNPALRLLVDEAKREGFPADNVKKAIEKGGGGEKGEAYEQASYEGFGPSGIQIIVDVLSSNTNRSVAELRSLMADVGGSMAEHGAISWNFDVVGWVNIMPGKMVKSEKFGAEDIYTPENKDEVELNVMGIEGVVDMGDSEDGSIDVYTDFKDLGKVRDAILATGYVVNKAQIAKIAKTKKKLAGEELEKALTALDRIEEYEDVQNIWTDLVA
ncbi:YebC/PmpR family DNA-binding transcriptional regulator [Candidatus Dojkabacteria bacterium]|jgi:YebC/PmpR family DNA-binding regulatory protein|nr:YebC/PmpR family DNA-binding transcriptional regulator [Candidatus Dojkabacteria bacterium]